jgi:hypothetical protein
MVADGILADRNPTKTARIKNDIARRMNRMVKPYF